MADYTPVALPGTTYTFTATGALAGGDLVGVVAGGMAVNKVSSLASVAYVGVAGHDAAIGQKVTVYVAKAIHESVADGAVAIGDQLTTTNTANRQVKTLAPVVVNVNSTFSDTEVEAAIQTAVNQARAVIGVAVTAVADNQLVRWVQR
jgi:hypothetical protein